MSLGKDLASIRKSKNLSLEDIQAAIKIPPDILKSIEDESIFSDTSMNKTYLRSFVRSYAKVLKIPNEDIVEALDALDAGTYTGNLYGGPELQSDDSDEIKDPELESITERNEVELEDESGSGDKEKPYVKTNTPSSGTESINWADMGRKFTTVSKSPRVWLPVSIFIVIGLVIGTVFLYWDDISTALADDPEVTQEPVVTDSEQDPVAALPVDSTAVNSEINSVAEQDQQSIENQPVGEPVTLGDTLTLSVYAAYGQLEPIRITSDMNWTTNPFWMEQGESYKFDFKDTLLVRGQYSRLLLLFNGHVIENPRQNYFDNAFNSIMITRSVLNQPKYLAPAPSEFPLQVGPPDSSVYRIRF